MDEKRGKETLADVLFWSRSLGAGSLIAQNGWTLLTGGRSEGVMEAASRDAKKSGARTIGILPFRDYDAAN